MVAWSVDGESDPNIDDIRFQDFNYRGQPVGTETQAACRLPEAGPVIPPGTTPNDVAVAMNGATGGFVVVWDQPTGTDIRRQHEPPSHGLPSHGSDLQCECDDDWHDFWRARAEQVVGPYGPQSAGGHDG